MAPSITQPECHLVAMFIVSVTMVTVFPGPSSGCSLVPGSKWTVYSMQDLFHMAPVAVVGEVLSLDEESNIGQFQLYCVLKWDVAGTTPTNEISISEAVFVHSCTSREAWAVGEKWMVALERNTEVVNATFSFYEPDVFNNAAYNCTSNNLQTVANVCGIDVHDVVPPGVNFDCPVTSVTEEDTCYKTRSSSATPGGGGLHVICGSLLVTLLFAMFHEDNSSS